MVRRSLYNSAAHGPTSQQDLLPLSSCALDLALHVDAEIASRLTFQFDMS